MTSPMAVALAGKTILIVEDDYLLATDLERTLTKAGAEVRGPYPRAQLALEAIETGDADGALIDINLNGSASFKVAEALDKRGVPFAFVTGHQTVPEAWRHVPFVSKPVERIEVLRVVNQMLS